MAKVKIPKQVAGVKVPKKVRKKAKKALKAAESPVVREFAAAALGAAAQAGTRRRANTSDAMRRVVGLDGDRVAEAIRDAALDGFRRFLEGFEEGLRKAAAPDRDRGDEPVELRDEENPVTRVTRRDRPGAGKRADDPGA